MFNKHHCRICYNKENNEIIMAKEMMLGTRESFPYILCSNCGSLSIAEVPSNIDKYYENYPNLQNFEFKDNKLRGFLKKYITSSSCFVSKCMSRFLDHYHDLKIKALHPFKFSKSISVLDVGCGSGQFVYDLNECGFKNVIGIDPNIQKDIIFDNGGMVLKKNIFEINGIFDLITLQHSYEHMEEVHEVAQKLDELLAPNGTCIIRLPNIESYSFRKFRQDWEGIHSPYHLFLPSIKGMQFILKNTNLRIAEIRGEQLIELFLCSITRTLNIADFEPLGIRTNLKDKPLRRKIPPLFTKQDLKYWKQKTKKVIKDKTTDYIVYYINKSGNND